MKAKHHVIEHAEFQDWLRGQEALFARSSRENKALYVSVGNGNIRVIVGGETVYLGTQPFDALEAYNAITEPYVNPLKDFKI